MQIRRCENCRYEERRDEHQFGTGEYKADNSCEQVRICRRCGIEQVTGPIHQFNKWEFVADNSCEQVWACGRCGFKEQGSMATHQFTPWNRLDEKTCANTRICKRCGYEERELIPHQFNEWTYLAPNTCEQIQVCRIYGYQDKRIEQRERVFLEDYQMLINPADERETFSRYQCSYCSKTWSE